ncbi:DHH family phosphoesterase [Candidatus Uhrbacteria bacterium]|nr:DHH family phosphoesterase [Candidatus Uhrbacteria bacterium]
MAQILVTAKINPDLDGTACALAYAYFLNEHGNDAEGMIFGSPQAEVSYFIDQHGISIPTRPDNTKGDWTQFVLVDASEMKGMPTVVTPEQVIEVIDHRAGSEPEKQFSYAYIQNELVGAAATLVTERFMRAGLRPSRENALLLYGAIHHNSLNFLATNTHRRDHDTVRFLEQEYGFDKKIIEEMFHYATDVICKDVVQAIVNDAKEFGTGYVIAPCQLIVWGRDVLLQTEGFDEGIENVREHVGAQWGFLNIVDVHTGTTSIYVRDSKGAMLLSRALELPISTGLTRLPMTILRKQIIPKLYAVLPR